MLVGGTDCIVSDGRAFCENLRRTENLRLQTIYRIGRNTLLFTINDVFSMFGPLELPVSRGLLSKKTGRA
jgi:hypothetical protein